MLKKPRNNTIDGNSNTFGINLGPENNAIVSGNIISDCEEGIYVSGGTPTIEYNLIINNLGALHPDGGGIEIVHFNMNYPEMDL
jgi:parallel beta-helix repeat protein